MPAIAGGTTNVAVLGTTNVAVIGHIAAAAVQPVTIDARSSRLGGRANYRGGAQQHDSYDREDCSFWVHRKKTQFINLCPFWSSSRPQGFEIPERPVIGPM
jgi:hypothetical protein